MQYTNSLPSYCIASIFLKIFSYNSQLHARIRSQKLIYFFFPQSTQLCNTELEEFSPKTYPIKAHFCKQNFIHMFEFSEAQTIFHTRLTSSHWFSLLDLQIYWPKMTNFKFNELKWQLSKVSGCKLNFYILPKLLKQCTQFFTYLILSLYRLSLYIFL